MDLGINLPLTQVRIPQRLIKVPGINKGIGDQFIITIEIGHICIHNGIGNGLGKEGTVKQDSNQKGELLF